MKKKTVSLIAASVACICLWNVRYVSFNNKISEIYTTPKVIYEVNDVVEYGDNIVELQSHSGYSVQVQKSEQMEMSEFIDKFNIKDEAFNFSEEYRLPDRICLITLEVMNDSNESEELFLGDLYLYGNDLMFGISPFVMDINEELYLRENYAIHPEIGGKRIVYLPYALYEDDFSGRQWNNIETYSLYLGITQFPVEQVIQIQ